MEKQKRKAVRNTSVKGILSLEKKITDKKTKNNLKSKNGITLIALVISIIVMLILAGVSINATVGDNGVLKQALQAKEAQEIARIEEELELMFSEYNIDNDGDDIAHFLQKKVDSGEIDEFQIFRNGSDFAYLIKKDGQVYYVAKEGDFYYATKTETNLDSIGAGITIITEDSFDESNGNLSFDLKDGESATLYFYDKVTGEFNFDILGGTVDIYVTQDMTLTNEGKSRSAIDVHSGATLNLYVEEGITLTANSGFATKGATGHMGEMKQNEGGDGAYAGIHVPEGATLNIKGKGTVVAYGGNATPGGAGTSASAVMSDSGNGGGRRRWRRSWNWWKWWKRRRK